MSEFSCDTCGRVSIRKRIHAAPPMTSEEFYGACSLQGNEDCLATAVNDIRAQLADAIRERDEAMEALDEVRHLAAVLLKAINEDEEHGIDDATVRAVVALRLAISKTGSINTLAAIRGTEGK